MTYLGHVDPNLPASKPDLQGWDNYGIYDLVCIDSVLSTYVSNAVSNANKKELQNFLAVQAYSIAPISCDFQAIVSTYN